MITDWTVELANYCRENLPNGDIEVYSDHNPYREWVGTPTLEFSVRDVNQINFISGGYKREIAMSALTRGENERQSETLTLWVLNTALRNALNELKSDNRIEGWTIEEIATSPDARGLATGESFYGYVDFTIYEKPTDF